MNNIKSLIVALGIAVLPVAAHAQPAEPTVAVKEGAMIFSADGRRIGRVDRIKADAVSVIYAGRFIYIPLSTLTASDRGFTSSLSRAEIAKK